MFIAASVWIKSSTNSSIPEPRSLPLEEIIPVVTVPPKPRELPIAITISPTLASLELPKETNGNFLSVLILINAKSVCGSLPIITAGSSVLSDNLTCISSDPAIT